MTCKSMKAIAQLILKGWVIEPTSCACGGTYAWLKPRFSGSYEMVGCICHNNPEKMLEEIENEDT